MIDSRSRMLCSSSTTSTRMSGIRGRERHGEDAAGPRAALDVDLAAVVLHDAVHQGQAEAAAVRLGGEERLEDVPEIGGRGGPPPLRPPPPAGGGGRPPP